MKILVLDDDLGWRKLFEGMQPVRIVLASWFTTFQLRASEGFGRDFRVFFFTWSRLLDIGKPIGSRVFRSDIGFGSSARASTGFLLFGTDRVSRDWMRQGSHA